ncbi:hypothetical protein MRX96_054683 [Rhipicephalus microplus]
MSRAEPSNTRGEYRNASDNVTLIAFHDGFVIYGTFEEIQLCCSSCRKEKKTRNIALITYGNFKTPVTSIRITCYHFSLISSACFHFLLYTESNITQHQSVHKGVEVELKSLQSNARFIISGSHVHVPRRPSVRSYFAETKAKINPRTCDLMSTARSLRKSSLYCGA